MSAVMVPAPQQRVSLVQKFAAKYSIEPEKLMGILKQTAFKVQQGEVSNEQMAALLVVADQYGLNPFTREIFAFEDKYKGIVPVVSVDGWARIINERPELDGLEFHYPTKRITAPEGGREAYEWIECVIHRKDREHPTKVREFLDEVYQPPRGANKIHGPWQTHPKRMHRHKTLIQCARVAFGFGGIYDEDEAQRIIDGESVRVEDFSPAKPLRGTAGLAAARARAEDVPETPAPNQPEGHATPPADQPQGAHDQPVAGAPAGQPDPAVADLKLADWIAGLDEQSTEDEVRAYSERAPENVKTARDFQKAVKLRLDAASGKGKR